MEKDSLSLIKATLKDFRVRETPHGFNSYCPYPEHDPKNSRSFHLNLEKGVAKCFSCGRGSSVFNFLLDFGVPVSVAVEYLKPVEFHKEYEQHHDFILGTKLPKSFIDRGFTPETLRHFEVGYDETEKRITIPIYAAGDIRGVFYRKYPKIMSYSENLDMRGVVYNYEPTEERTYVEGFTDCFRVWQSGTNNVSALLTSKINIENQLDLIKKHKVVNLALDFDTAGLEGMFYAYELLKYHCEVNIIPYKADLIKEGEKGYKNDPGNCSEKAWKRGFFNKLSFQEFELVLLTEEPELYEILDTKRKKFSKSLLFKK